MYVVNVSMQYVSAMISILSVAPHITRQPSQRRLQLVQTGHIHLETQCHNICNIQDTLPLPHPAQCRDSRVQSQVSHLCLTQNFPRPTNLVSIKGSNQRVLEKVGISDSQRQRFVQEIRKVAMQARGNGDAGHLQQQQHTVGCHL